jgi:GT2 family glycosyltransferase
MHEISVIISNFNGAKYLPLLLATLKRQRGVNLEIIVVDRLSTDASAEILAGHPDVKIVSHPPLSGLVSGYHRGVAEATKDRFFFMNEDMWLAPDALQKCCELMEQRVRCAAVMPVQWTYDGKEVVNTGIWFTRCWWNRACPSLRHRSYWHLLAEPARVSYANAGACLIRRDAYEETGGWDTSFFLDDEDTDLNLRLWQRGWESWVQPSAVIGHAVGASNSKEISPGKSVSKRRYVCGLSNYMTLALKSFSLLGVLRPLLSWMDRFARNWIKGRWQLVGFDVEALWLTVGRLPDIIEYRHRNRVFNKVFPGERYFYEPLFQREAIVGNRAGTTNVTDVAQEAVAALNASC